MTDNPETRIRNRIDDLGKITFAEFMQTALFHKSGGYYTKPSVFGDQGDFYTSPGAHPAFGALTANLLHRMWRAIGNPAPFHVIELGAGAGILSRDIVDHASRIDKSFSDSVRYISVDRYLANESANSTNSIQNVMSDTVPFRNVEGCIISNELVDSFPVHRFQISDGFINEIYVALDARGNFVETLDEPSNTEIANRLHGFKENLPDGYRGEVNLGLTPWMKQVSSALHRGFVVTIDYGYPSEVMYAPERVYGTFDTYYRHTRGASPFQRIGRQDMTAHVDFTALANSGTEHGLEIVGLVSQSGFLKANGFDDMLTKMRSLNLSESVIRANVMGMLDLVKPGGLGDFGVLIQQKNTEIRSLTDLPELTQLASEDLPKLSEDHSHLLSGAFPDQTFELESLWPFTDKDS